MRRNDDPDFLLDCDRCGQTYGVQLDCDHGFSRFVAFARPRLCSDCRTARPPPPIDGGAARRGR